MYYGDNEGWFPADDLACITANAKYLKEMPLAKLPGTGHGDVATVVNTYADGGGWYYANDITISTTWGNFVVSCSHEDIKGRDPAGTQFSPWSTF